MDPTFDCKSPRQGEQAPRKTALISLGYSAIFVGVFTVFSTAFAAPEPRPIRILMDRPPVTLDPRRALDATSQRLGALFFSALTHLDADLVAIPDVAESWRWDTASKTFWFRFKKSHSFDHAGHEISAQDFFSCMENYRDPKSPALITRALKHWKQTILKNNEIGFVLTHADFDFPRQVSLLRFFRVGTQTCVEPRGSEKITTSGILIPDSGSLPLEPPTFQLDAKLTQENQPFRFLFVRDEITRALVLKRSGADVAQNQFPSTKFQWILDSDPERFQVFGREGRMISFLVFNTHAKPLDSSDVRRALALAIDRATMMRAIDYLYTEKSNTLFSFKKAEPDRFSNEGDLNEAGRILDRAGFPLHDGKPRFELVYKTTPVREGYEAARIFKETWEKLGIRIHIEMLEPSVFFTQVRRGEFGIVQARFVGVSDLGILSEVLGSHGSRNAAQFSDLEVDSLLHAAESASTESARTDFYEKAQAAALAKFPIYPLWVWNNRVIADRNLESKSPLKLSLSGALEPLLQLRWRPVK